LSLSCIKIEKILYATDFSENARLAFAHAVSLAGMYRARITVLHVMTKAMDLVSGYIGRDEWQRIKAKHMQSAKDAHAGTLYEAAAVREALLQFIEKTQHVQGMSAFEVEDVLIESGNPVEAILRVAEEKRADLIVMGRCGTGMVDGTMLGSTTSRVLKRSRVSVLAVWLPEGGNECSPIDWRSCLPAI